MPGATLESLNGLYVMVVDDEADFRDALVGLLEQAGARAAAVGSVASALAAFEECAPDIVVADLAMPKEDGYSLLERLRSRPPERGGRVPAVALTGFAGPQDQARALDAGFQVCLTKPVEPGDLIAALARLVASPAREA